MTNYNARRRYTPNSNKAERTGDLYNEIFALRKAVEELTAERDRLRGSVALYEAELAVMTKRYEGAYNYVRSIEGGI